MDCIFGSFDINETNMERSLERMWLYNILKGHASTSLCTVKNRFAKSVKEKP